MPPSRPRLLYLDSSSFLTLLLAQPGWEAIERVLARHEAAGGTIASSRLLWLEARRVAIHEALLGNNIRDPVGQHLSAIEQLPVTDQVWERAVGIGQHVRTLDALHLATCELVGATLVGAGLDRGLRRAAISRGTPLAVS